MNENTKQLRSIGRLVADLQRPHAAIVATIERLGIRPSIRLNDVPYYDSPAVARIYTAIGSASDTNKHERKSQ